MSDDPLVGTTLGGRFTLLERLGSGGMGNVYRALQTALDREVAVKVLNPYYASRPSAVRRFNREARAASRLEHPRIVRVYDFGTADDGQLYIAMELVRGESLKARMRQIRGMKVSDAARILAEVCDALAEAHSQGVIHRDLKPDNVMLVSGGLLGGVKVLDFGIAKIIEPGASEDESVTRDVVGTPEYMAPEQILGDSVGSQTDLYSVGINLYEMLTNERPFGGKSSVQTYLAHLNDEIPPPPSPLPSGEECPATVVALWNRLLSKERIRRPSSAAAVARALREIALGGTPNWTDLGTDAAVGESAAPPAAVADGSGDQDELSGATLADRAADGLTLLRQEQETVEARIAAHQPSPLNSVRQERRDVVVVHAVVTVASAYEWDVEDRLTTFRSLHETWDRVVEQHGGTVLRPGTGASGAVTAVFGAPIAREDDLFSALRCALALRAARPVAAIRAPAPVPSAGAGAGAGAHPLLIHCGVASGQVIASDTAHGLEVLGDVPVRAAMLAADAPGHGIAVADSVVQECQARLRVSPLSSESSSGGARAWLLHGIARPDECAPSVVEGVHTRMIGRRAERAELRQLTLRVANERAPRLIVVSGEAGVGKSRLVREHIAWLRGAVPAAEVYIGRAEAVSSSSPLALLHTVLGAALGFDEQTPHGEAHEKLSRGLAPVLGAAAESSARYLAAALGCASPEDLEKMTSRHDPKVVRDRGIEAFVAALEAQARTRPVVILLEDLHWADRTSLEWVSAAMPLLAELPVCILCTCRPELFERDPIWRADGAYRTHLALHPLSAIDSARQVRELLQRMQQLPDELVHFIVDRADGNPFYAEELVKALVAHGVIHTERPNWTADFHPGSVAVIPRGVRALLLARLDALPADARDALRAAAVVGRTFWRGAVRELFSPGDDGRLMEVLATVEERGFVYRRHASSVDGEVEYQFEHALVRDVAYASLLRQVRRTCHVAVADWLEANRAVTDGHMLSQVARHAELGGDLERAFDRYYRAGALAAKMYANADGVALFERALDVGMQSPELSRAALARAAARMGEALEVMSRFGEARGAYEQATSLVGANAPRSVRAEYARLRARAGYRAGMLDAAMEELDVLQAEVAGLSAPVRLAIAADRGWLYHVRGREDEARAQLEAELDSDPQADSPNLDSEENRAEAQAWIRARANALNVLGTVCLYSGRWPDAAEHYERARALYRQVEARHAEGACLLNQGVVFLATQRLQAAAAALLGATQLLTEVGYEHGVANAQGYLARVRRRQGRLAEAEDLSAQAFAWATGASVPLLAAEAATERSAIHLSRRQWHEALDWGQRAVALAEQAGAPETLALALGARGRARYALRGEGDQLEGALEDLRRGVDTFGGGFRRDERARLEWALGLALDASPHSDPAESARQKASALRTLRALGLSGEASALELSANPIPANQ